MRCRTEFPIYLLLYAAVCMLHAYRIFYVKYIFRGFSPLRTGDNLRLQVGKRLHDQYFDLKDKSINAIIEDLPAPCPSR